MRRSWPVPVLLALAALAGYAAGARPVQAQAQSLPFTIGETVAISLQAGTHRCRIEEISGTFARCGVCSVTFLSGALVAAPPILANETERSMTIGWRAARAAASVCVMLAIGATAVGAATLPAGFTESLVASGLNNPPAMPFALDGRPLVCAQGGRLRVSKNGALSGPPFHSVTV